MKKATSADASLNDDDIAQLFACQTAPVPDALKRSILEQAKLPASEDGIPGRTSSRLWVRGFGVAASCFIAVILAPMLLNQPESPMAIPDPAAPMFRQADDSMTDTNHMAETIIMTEEEAPITIDQESSGNMARISAVTSASSPSYRQSADKWMNEIKVMLANGDAQQARDEYQLFSQEYPAQAKDFKPEFDRQPVIDDQTTDGSDQR
ncbi:MAG: hypothetical protein AB8B97_26465 [Granulosicoccus sp.]